MLGLKLNHVSKRGHWLPIRSNFLYPGNSQPFAIVVLIFAFNSVFLYECDCRQQDRLIYTDNPCKLWKQIPFFSQPELLSYLHLRHLIFTKIWRVACIFICKQHSRCSPTFFAMAWTKYNMLICCKVIRQIHKVINSQCQQSFWRLIFLNSKIVSIDLSIIHSLSEIKSHLNSTYYAYQKHQMSHRFQPTKSIKCAQQLYDDNPAVYIMMDYLSKR